MEVHQHDGLSFFVKDVQCHHKASSGRYVAFRRCWRMLVCGPLPSNEDTHGDSIMIALDDGHLPWWRISTATGPCERCALLSRFRALRSSHKSTSVVVKAQLRSCKAEVSMSRRG